MNKFTVLLTAATVISGNAVRAGTTIDLDKELAENLIYRGRAELVTGDDEQDINLSQMTDAQLAKLARELKLEGYSKLNRDEPIAAIADASAE